MCLLSAAKKLKFLEKDQRFGHSKFYCIQHNKYSYINNNISQFASNWKLHEWSERNSENCIIQKTSQGKAIYAGRVSLLMGDG